MSPRAARATVLGLALAALHPLLGARLQLGHDAERYPVRLGQFARAVRERHLPPVWAPDLSCGHGQPHFEFAPPLCYALALPLLALGLPVATAIQLPIAALTLGGAVATRALARRWGGEPGGVLAAAAFLFAPYLQVDLYVRAAWAESAALALLPVGVLALVHDAARPGPAALALLAAVVAGIAASHPPGFLLAAGVLSTLAVALAVAARSPWPALRAGLALGLGSAAAALAWLPAFLERGLVKTALLDSPALRFDQHFVLVRQLVWSRWGFGHSLPGPDDGMPFHVGPIAVVLGAVGVVAAARSGDRSRQAVAIAAAGLTLGAAFLATAASRPLWETLPLLRYFGYPWRVLGVPAVLLPLLAASAAPRLGRWPTLATTALLALFSVRHAGAWGSRPVAGAELDGEATARRCARSTLLEEFEPATASAGLAYEEAPLQAPEAAGVAIATVARAAGRERYRVRVPASAAPGAELRARTFYYPGWIVRADGAAIAAAPEPGSGRIAFRLPPGEHDVRLDLEPTATRRLAAWVAAAGSAGILALLAMATAARRRGWQR